MPTNKVKILSDAWKLFPGIVNVSVDPSSKSGKLSQQIDGIFVGVSPVIRLLDTFLVSCGEGTVVVQSSDAHPKLCHGVQSLWEAARISASFDSGIGNL